MLEDAGRTVALVAVVIGGVLAVAWLGVGVVAVAAVLWLVPLYVCHEQGKAKNRPGFWWGFFLGWLGVLTLAALPPATEAKS